MKNKIIYALTIIVFILLLPLFLGNSSYKRPNVYYQVYLDGNYEGTIKSKSELTKYINSQSDTIRDNVRSYKADLEAIDTFNKLNKSTDGDDLEAAKELIANAKELKIDGIELENLNTYLDKKLYNLSEYDIETMKQYITDNEIYMYTQEVFTPNGIEIKKVYTYEDKLMSVPEIYKKIVSEKTCTVAGYKFTIKSDSEDTEDIVIYTLDKNTFNDAVDKFITVFISEEDYEAYRENKQEEISTVGEIIEKVYIEEDISYKAMNVSIEEKIYTDSTELSNFLLYGNDYSERIVTVSKGDTIESIAFDNKISVQEFLISNSQYTSRENLIAPGTKIKIAAINPKLQVVVETYEVLDRKVQFNTIETYDENANQGSLVVVQNGEDGLERVSQSVKSINGQVTYVEPNDKTTIKQSVPKIIKIGTKYVPNVGSIISWEWPTTSWYLSSYYGYRPAFGDMHYGIDIAAGYGAPIYAANNGTIKSLKIYRNAYGNYTDYGISALIDHNNGYYTLYAHMSGYAAGIAEGMTVTRGQLIGYVGSTGFSTGPHLHFEIRNCEWSHCAINPLNFY